MENEGIIYKIKSIYIIKNILNYIKANEIQKLFLYSKYFQNQLNIEYIDAKEKYLKKIGFDINEYLYINEDKYELNVLNEKYDKFLSETKINKNLLENLIYEIYENKQIKGINQKKETYINIDSPLFDIISKLSHFEKNYTICIYQKIIDEYNLIYEYMNKFFDKLKKPNIKYISVIYFSNYKEIKYLGRLNIDTKITKLILKKVENLKCLEYMNFKELERLDLSKNYISDISVLGKVKSENLKDLDLYHNNISYINVLRIVKFEKLEKLNLSWNKISNINILEDFNFKELKELNLNYNNISDIKVLGKVKFEKLEKLNLGWNQISNINILENVNFKELKDLDLYHNDISDINVLEKVKFEKLEKLNLGWNQISNINILEYVNFKELKELYLFKNNISKIEVLEKVIFEKLEKLNVACNKIDKDKFCSIINNLKLKFKYFILF